MQVEIRNGSVKLDGYVNVPLRDSRMLPSPRGQFVEQIMPKVFDQALRNNDNVNLLFNHNEQRKLGSTKEGNLELFEDSIGLRAICTVNDPEIMDKAAAGQLKGWSFGFVATEQRWQEGSDGVQRRYVDGLDLLEVSILDVTPAYFATTIESRGEGSIITEQRFEEVEVRVIDLQEKEEQAKDQEQEEQQEVRFEYAPYEREIEILKLKGGNY